jgi:PEP-CTERM motif
MRRTALPAAAIGCLFTSSSFGALVVSLFEDTSSNAPVGSKVYFLSVKDNASPVTAIQAQSVEVAMGSGKLLFPDGDEFGGVGTGSSASAIASRSHPSGTWAFLPSATNVATFGSQIDVSNGEATVFSAQSFRTGSAYTTTAAQGLIIGALVITAEGGGSISGTVNSTLNPANNVAFSVYGGGEWWVEVTPQVVTVDVSPAGLEGFSGVAVTAHGGTLYLQEPIPAQIADNITISGLGTGNATVAGSGFTYADAGTYVLRFNSGFTPDTLTIHIVPEPASLGLVGLASLSMSGRHKRPSTGRPTV